MHTTSHGGINSKLHNNVMNFIKKAELMCHLMLCTYMACTCVCMHTRKYYYNMNCINSMYTKQPDDVLCMSHGVLRQMVYYVTWCTTSHGVLCHMVYYVR